MKMKLLLFGFLTSCNLLFSQKNIEVFPEFNYFFSDENPRVYISNNQTQKKKVVVILKSGRIVFSDSIASIGSAFFNLLPIEKEEFDIKSDGHINVPIRVLSNQDLYNDTLSILTLPRKDNAVRIHFLSGAMETSLSTQHHFVGKEQRTMFFPFGFYARERDDFEWILRTESMNGFNLYSPYQAIEDSTLFRRKAYMDLCAELGMRVNYNLQQVCPLKENDSPELKRIKLKKVEQEVRMFRDHPALLSWYVCDEPDGQFIKPSELEEAVALIRKLDPHHPISMVFVDPKPSLPYQDLLDIVMTDPYPIPGNSVVNAGEYLEKLKNFYEHKKHIWIVPQAFGGQEFWQREPTPQELRAMVYLGVIHGARASQAFIRHIGQSFPKNPEMWSAYHQTSRELNYLAKDLQYQNEIKDFKQKDWWKKMKVDAACFKGENPNHQLFVLVNLENQHKIINCPLGQEYENGLWHFINENRWVKSEEMFEWVLNPYEVKLVRFERNLLTPQMMMNKEWEGNRILDFSFEKWTGPGIPTACYLHMSKEHGATAFLDRSIAHHGEVSLRLNNLGGVNANDNSQEISFFQFSTTANHAYVFSFWAYAEQSGNKEAIENTIALRIEKPWGKFIWHDTIGVRSGWNRYDVSYIPKEGEDRNMLELRILNQGFVWIDQVQWVESPSFEVRGEIFDSLQTMHAEVVGDICSLKNIKYAYYPTGADTVVVGNGEHDLLMRNSGTCEVQYPLPNGEIQKSFFPIRTKYSKINKMEYLIESSLKYPAGGKEALIDGELGEFVWDGKWQGFEGTNFEVDFEISDVQARQIELRALSKKSAWVYWPAEVELFWSSDGLNYESVQKISTQNQDFVSADGVKTYGFSMQPNHYARLNQPSRFKIRAQSIQKLPADHPFVGEKSWVFVDEILVH